MFHELLSNPTRREPGPLQCDAGKQFPNVVQQSHLEQRVPGTPIPTVGKYIVIGVATFAPDDLKLLDDVNATYPQWRDSFKIAVFDIMQCHDKCDVQNYLPSPSLVPAVQTPVIAFWDQGSPLSMQTGLHKTREMLRQTGVLK